MIKILNKILLCLMLIFVVFSGFSTQENVYAISEAERTQLIQNEIKSELLAFIEYEKNNEDKQRNIRIPGSDGEYNAAIYLKNKLSGLNNFIAVNNQSTHDGIERFEFQSIYDGNMYTSQNVIFKRESLIETNRKIILCAHYDTSFIEKEDAKYSDFKSTSEGINDNASSVATLLALVKNLDKMDLDYGFDVEVVFFGASTNNYDGAKYYMRGQSELDANDTLLVINLDKIAIGNYNYIYVNEFETKQEKFVLDLLYGFKKLKNENHLDFNQSSPNGLNYTHIGLESDHAIFMKRNINVVSFFSGDYESLITYGINEFNDKENVTFTENDAYLYIDSNYNNFYANLARVYKAVNLIISDDDFVATMEKDNHLKEKYTFWTNEKLAVIISLVVVAGFVIVYFIIYKNLQDKSKELITSSNIQDVVFKITSSLSEKDNQELNDAINQKVKSDTEDDKKE